MTVITLPNHTTARREIIRAALALTAAEHIEPYDIEAVTISEAKLDAALAIYVKTSLRGVVDAVTLCETKLESAHAFGLQDPA